MPQNGRMTIRVGLSTSSLYPGNAATAFATAARLGYDAIEVMVWTDPVTQEPGALRALSELHELPIASVHAPTLLLTVTDALLLPAAVQLPRIDVTL